MTKVIHKYLYVAIINIFMFVTIFDPADLVLGLKAPLFLLSIGGTTLICLDKPGKIYLPKSLIIYILLFILIPLISIFFYYLRGETYHHEGFSLLKAYIFISYAIVFVVSDVDVTKYLSRILLLMGFCIIFLFFFLVIFPEYFGYLNTIGPKTGIFYPGIKYYDGFEVRQAYFACSPMLVLPIAYYFFRFRESLNKDFWSLSFLVVSIVALFLSGTRNSILIAAFMPLFLFVIFSRKFYLSLGISSIIMIALFLIFFDELVAFFDPIENGNRIKLSYLNDYIDIFSDINNLVFGQGLGSYYKFSIYNDLAYITELTFIEVFRNFGLIFGFVMILLIIYPIYKSFSISKSTNLHKYIAVAYSFYLIMCFTNPNFFSSMGILMLCVLLSGLYNTR